MNEINPGNKINMNTRRYEEGEYELRKCVFTVCIYRIYTVRIFRSKFKFDHKFKLIKIYFRFRRRTGDFGPDSFSSVL